MQKSQQPSGLDPELMNAFAAFMASQKSAPDAVTASVLANMPTPATQQAPPEPVTRKLDDVSVQLTDDVVFVITPTVAGRPATAGARIVPYVKGRKQRSLNRLLLATLTPTNQTKLAKAVDRVEAAALIGKHAPTQSEEEESE